MVTRSRRKAASSALTPSGAGNPHLAGAGGAGSSTSCSSSSPVSNNRRSSMSRVVKKGTPPNGSSNKSISRNASKENPSSRTDKYNKAGNGGTMGLRSTKKSNPSSLSSSSSPLAKASSSSSPRVTGAVAKSTPTASSGDSGTGKGIGNSSKKKKTSAVDTNVLHDGEDPSPTRNASFSSSRTTRSADGVADAKTPQEDKDTLLSRRPKRKAASSVRFGSYKDMENNVDYTLLLDSFAISTSTTSAPASSYDKKSSSTRANGKTSSSYGGGKRKSSKLSPAKASSSSSSSTRKISAKKQNQGALVRMTRSNLMTSKKAPGTASTARKQEERPISLNNVTSSQRQKARLNLTNLLPPVLIERHSGNITPSMLRSLSRDAKVEIFNRKTGRIMRGDEAIPIRGLVRALQEHAEYEPILPCPTKRAKKEQQQDHTYRESRTSPNARVSSVVHPQTTMVRTSTIEGRHVLVTGGSQKGLIGKVYACIPGGWYMITDASNPDDFEYLIHSKNLRMINKNNKSTTATLDNVSDTTTKGAGIKGTVGQTKVVTSSQKKTRDIYSRPNSQEEILKLRNKIKELETKQLNIEKSVDQDTKQEEGGGASSARTDDKTKKALDDISKTLEETKSELQTKIFLGEILACSGV